MGDRLDLDDRDAIAAWLEENLLDAGGVAEVIGLAHRNNVYGYQRQYPDFPVPILTRRRCYMWLRGDITAWMRARKGR